MPRGCPSSSSTQPAANSSSSGSAPSSTSAPSTSGGRSLGPGVPRGAKSEDDGWLVCLGFDTQSRRSEFLVFDAWALMSGPVARLAIPSALPHQLHGTWAGAYFGPQQQQQQAAVQA